MLLIELNSIRNMGCQKIKKWPISLDTSCVCQVAVISKRSNDKQKSFVSKKNMRHVSIRDFKKQKI